MKFKPGQTYYIVSDSGVLYTIIYIGPFKDYYEVFHCWCDSDDLDDYEYIHLDPSLKSIYHFGDFCEPIKVNIYDNYEQASNKVNKIKEIKELRKKVKALSGEQLLELLRGKI